MKLTLEKPFPSGKVVLQRQGTGYEVSSPEGKVGEIKAKTLLAEKYNGEVSEDGRTLSVETFIHLHVHSEYSIQDGMIRMDDLIKHAGSSLALTDHGNMFGMVKFYKGMKKEGKHPVLGCEVYVESIDGEKNSSHLILLAKNNVGVKNLFKIVSDAYHNFYRKPHVSIASLRENAEGLICLSACLAGEIPKAISAGNTEKAEATASEYIKIFGKENFFFEIQRHNIGEDEEKVIDSLIALSKKFDIPFVATVDSHYLSLDDKEAHEVLLCLQTSGRMTEKHFSFSGEDYHLLSCEEMERKFQDIPEALANTIKVASLCQGELDLGHVSMPKIDVPSGFSSVPEYFSHLAKEGFKTRFEGTEKAGSKEYIERFNYELDMILKMGFADYFVIIWDFINWARNNGIMVGPGRGSAVGSLVAYCLGITDLDPIPYALFFERFLNPERVSMPDIDTDIEDSKRPEVIKYLTEKYGAENTSKIITYGRMKAKSVLKDVARCFDYPVTFGNELAKFIPEEAKMTIEKALEENPDFASKYEADVDTRKVVDIAKRLEGIARQTSQHACGFLAAPSKVTDFLPTILKENPNTKKKETTSQTDMVECEDMGLIKFDLLGLRNLGVISETFRMVKENYGVELTTKDIPFNDRRVYEALSKGKTVGVFQLESAGMTELIKNMFSDIDSLKDEELDSCFERLIAAVALYRPGPMDYIPQYLENMANPDNIKYDVPELESILRPTYGIIVYQEQVMQIVQKLAGYTLGRADVVRKGMGKKKQDVMDAEEKVFINGNLDYASEKGEKPVNGCVNNGISKEIAESIWGKMKKFAEYAFNKSHATAYAAIAAYTAYLSVYYPKEFYAATVNSVLGTDSFKYYMNLLSKEGIKILPPSVNHSYADFRVLEDEIRFGFRGLKSINKNAELIAEVRGDIPYESLQDMVERIAKETGVALNSAFLESLILSGSTDEFPGTRAAKMLHLEALMKDGKFWAERANSDQMSMFESLLEIKEASTIHYTEDREYDKQLMLKKEKEIAGLYLTGNPLEDFLPALKHSKKTYSVSDVVENKPERDFVIYGIVTDATKRFSAKGNPFLTFSLEDSFSGIKAVCFSEELQKYQHLIVDDMLLAIRGYIKEDDFGLQFYTKEVFALEAFCSAITPKCITIDVKDKEEQSEIVEKLNTMRGSDVRINLRAMGKEYPMKKKIRFTGENIRNLKENFRVELQY